jgi:hypothetical protein
MRPFKKAYSQTQVASYRCLKNKSLLLKFCYHTKTKGIEKLFPKKIHANTLSGFLLKIVLFLLAFQIDKAFNKIYKDLLCTDRHCREYQFHFQCMVPLVQLHRNPPQPYNCR